ncbi:MAG: hypothetical protein HW381_1771, partial [Candidatus Rokubacteria bacterium]|nr:hypothetical protein [Candidatus Rokubacteria bacterium]
GHDLGLRDRRQTRTGGGRPLRPQGEPQRLQPAPRPRADGGRQHVPRRPGDALRRAGRGPGGVLGRGRPQGRRLLRRTALQDVGGDAADHDCSHGAHGGRRRGCDRAGLRLARARTERVPLCPRGQDRPEPPVGRPAAPGHARRPGAGQAHHADVRKDGRGDGAGLGAGGRAGGGRQDCGGRPGDGAQDGRDAPGDGAPHEGGHQRHRRGAAPRHRVSAEGRYG